ncbi:hypothetical protein J3369_02575 [Alteromonas sp. NFXS44]|uniref:hypothetical protein n=1 Tax=Alteromonas sp. NFXS44 TaxID=2818435 RepID=UPI0032DF0E1C
MTLGVFLWDGQELFLTADRCVTNATGETKFDASKLHIISNQPPIVVFIYNRPAIFDEDINKLLSIYIEEISTKKIFDVSIWAQSFLKFIERYSLDNKLENIWLYEEVVNFFGKCGGELNNKKLDSIRNSPSIETKLNIACLDEFDFLRPIIKNKASNLSEENLVYLQSFFVNKLRCYSEYCGISFIGFEDGQENPSICTRQIFGTFGGKIRCENDKKYSTILNENEFHTIGNDRVLRSEKYPIIYIREYENDNVKKSQDLIFKAAQLQRESEELVTIGGAPNTLFISKDKSIKIVS